MNEIKKNIKQDVVKHVSTDILYKHISRIIANSDIDFIASVYSHWHAIGLDSFVYDISQRSNKKPGGIIIINSLTNKEGKEEFAINENDFICKDFANVEFYFADNNLNKLQNQKSIVFRTYKGFNILMIILMLIEKIKKQKKNNKRKLYIVSVVNPDIISLRIFRNKKVYSKYFPVFSQIDEGVGTHASKKIRRIIRNLNNQNKKLNYFIKNIELEIKQIIYNFLKEIILKYIKCEMRFLFKKKHNKYIPNWSIIKSYKTVLKKRKKYIRNIKGMLSPVIILTSTFSEEKLASLKYELSMVESVVNILIKKGFSVIIKPHPFEKTNKYLPILEKFKREKVKLIQQNFPIEDLFFSLNPLCVIGYPSTALINANIMFDIPAISIHKSFLNNNNISEVKSKLIKTIYEDVFKDLSKGIVYNVESFENLEDILNSIKSKKFLGFIEFV